MTNAIDEEILRNLAWTFTVLSAVVSIALSIHRFGLSPGKRIASIIGVFVCGVAVAILFISDLSPLKKFRFLTSTQKQQISDAHNKVGNQTTGYEVTDEGVKEESASGEVNRVSEFIYGVIHPDGKIIAVYNGGFFDAEIDGKTVNCELIVIDEKRVLIIKGEELETIDLGSTQSESTFKVQKVPVARKS